MSASIRSHSAAAAAESTSSADVARHRHDDPDWHETRHRSPVLSPLTVQIVAAAVISLPAAANAALGTSSWLSFGLVLVLALAGVWLLSAAGLWTLTALSGPSGRGNAATAPRSSAQVDRGLVQPGTPAPAESHTPDEQRTAITPAADSRRTSGEQPGEAMRTPLAKIDVARVPAGDVVQGSFDESDDTTARHPDGSSAEPIGSLR